MFGFLDMLGTYEARKVARYEKGNILVDTAMVTDSDKPYETAIEHPRYNNGKIIIVELYDTKTEAKKGHAKWVKIMTSKKLPTEIKDVSTCAIVKMFGIKLESYRKAVKE